MAFPSPAGLFLQKASRANQDGRDIFAGGRGLLAWSAGPFWKAVASWKQGERPFCSSSSDLADKTYPSVLLHFLEVCKA